MAKLSLDLSQFKAAGVYTLEIDNTERISVTTQSLRLVVGFSEVGPQNTPVFIKSIEERERFFGKANPALERKGSFFHRMIDTCLQSSPVFAISLLPVDTSSSNNDDKVDICAMSLNVSEMNKSFGVKENISQTPYFSLFNRGRFWKPDSEYLQSQMMIACGVTSANEEETPLLQFANINTRTMSILAFKPNNLSGYNIFAKDWYGSESKIPYEWIKPYNKISDYFLQVIAIEGNWDNYKSLSVDPYWSAYFDENGIKTEKLSQFLALDTVNVIGNWIGSIIPDFKDKTDSNLYLESIINSSISLTGLMVNVNNYALDEYDYNDESMSLPIDLLGEKLHEKTGDIVIKTLSYDKTFKPSELFKEISHVIDCGITGKYKPNQTTLLIDSYVTDEVSVNDGDNVNIGDLIITGGDLAYVTNKLWLAPSVSSDYINEAGEPVTTESGAWVIYTSLPVKLNTGAVSGVKSMTLQKNIFDESMISNFKFAVMNGLTLGKKHLPGYDVNGSPSAEKGVEKIYVMLQDEGINRGLINPDMISYRYIIDTMAYGLRPNMGGKSHLSKLAKQRGKTTAILNAPSIKQFERAQDPYFCDTFVPGALKPIFSTKWIPEGGNPNMQRSFRFSLPDEDHGAKFCGVFGPFLRYMDGKTILVPPAADVSNAYIRKYMGGDPYAIVANKNGLLSNPLLGGVEYLLDKYDREYLESFGYNSIIEKPSTAEVMVYANTTSFRNVKSDHNSLHVREILNTIEIECDEALQSFVFEKNNSITRLNVINTLTPILQTIKDAGALYDYDIIISNENDTDMLIIDISVSITKGMEKILQRISLSGSRA